MNSNESEWLTLSVFTQTKLDRVIVLADEPALLRDAARFAQACQGSVSPVNLTVLMYGDLGSGKTSFVRGVLRALGHSGAVKSPTYTLVEPYLVAGMQVYHFDLYRLADEEELELMGFRDYFAEAALSFVEWPSKAGGLLPAADIAINLTVHANEGDKDTVLGRKLECLALSDAGLLVAKRWEVSH